jgi:transcriptional regulator of met regulon
MEVHMSDAISQTTPTAEHIGEALDPYQRAGRARTAFKQIEEAAKKEVDRVIAETTTRVAIAKAHRDATVAELQAWLDELNQVNS